MQIQKSNASKLVSILLLIAALLSVSITRNMNADVSLKGSKDFHASTKAPQKKSNEIFLKNVTIEAVVPFAQLDLLHHFVTAPYFFYSEITLRYIDYSSPTHINKYLKILFLFIIPSNAP